MEASNADLKLIDISKRDEDKKPKMKKASYCLKTWVHEWIRIMQALTYINGGTTEVDTTNEMFRLSEDELEERRRHAVDRILYEMSFQH